MATSPRRAARRRSAAAALAAALLLTPAASSAAAHAAAPSRTPVAGTAADARFVGQVTDALRTPAHKLAAGDDGRALADLVFLDREAEATAYRTCIVRRAPPGGTPLRTCFTTTTGEAGVVTVTPLRFRRGRYVVRWTAGGAVVASWRFAVV